METRSGGPRTQFLSEDSMVIALDGSKYDGFGEDGLIVGSEASRLEVT